MNIYLISQTKVQGYDVYDSAVVVAKSEADARSIHPDGRVCKIELDRRQYDWTTQQYVDVELIGVPFEGVDRGVICASFNAA